MVHLKNQYKQRGFSLFIVMVIMIIIALIVLVTSQTANTEMRMSTNEADRKFAITLAEIGLLQAETEIKRWAEDENQEIKFSTDCTNGLCAPAKDTYTDSSDVQFKFVSPLDSNVVAWKRCQTNLNKVCENGTDKSILDTGCKAIDKCKMTADGKANYIIEYLGKKLDGSGKSNFFRVTSRAHGNNNDTVVTLQTYLELEY